MTSTIFRTLCASTYRFDSHLVVTAVWKCSSLWKCSRRAAFAVWVGHPCRGAHPDLCVNLVPNLAKDPRPPWLIRARSITTCRYPSCYAIPAADCHVSTNSCAILPCSALYPTAFCIAPATKSVSFVDFARVPCKVVRTF